MEPMEIGATIQDSLKMVRASIPATIEIRQDLSAKNQTIEGNPVQISQILLNLCINAAHAIEEIDGVIEVTLRNRNLDDAAALEYPDLVPGSYVELMVRDNGPGIAPHNLHRIFDPYFTTKDVGKGSGMGLAVVLGIVKTHQGAMTVDSEPDKGACFSVLFPLIAAVPVTTEAKPFCL